MGAPVRIIGLDGVNYVEFKLKMIILPLVICMRIDIGGRRPLIMSFIEIVLTLKKFVTHVIVCGSYFGVLACFKV
jgi:hypothetical protein